MASSPLPPRDASPAAEPGTADDLLERLMQADEQLAELLSTASNVMHALAPSPGVEPADTEPLLEHWFATLNVTLRHAAHALRHARFPPLMTPAAAHARLSGEAGVAGQAHTLSESLPYSMSTLRLREAAWRQVAAALAHVADASPELRAALAQGAALV